MTLFVRDLAQRQPVINDLTEWAKAAVDAHRPCPGLAKSRLDPVEVFRIPG